MASVTFDTVVGGDGSTVTDDDNAATGLGNGGSLIRLVPMMAQVVAVANTVVESTQGIDPAVIAANAVTATTQAGISTTKANESAASAAAATAATAATATAVAT